MGMEAFDAAGEDLLAAIALDDAHADAILELFVARVEVDPESTIALGQLSRLQLLRGEYAAALATV